MTVSKRNALSKLVFTQMKDTVLIRTCKYLVVSGHFLLYINGYFILYFFLSFSLFHFYSLSYVIKLIVLQLFFAGIYLFIYFYIIKFIL